MIINQRPLRRATALVAMLLFGLLAGAVVSTAPVAAQTGSNQIIGVVSSSFSVPPDLGQAQARGSLITIFTARPVTDQAAQSNPFPWPTSLAGVRVIASQCRRGGADIDIELPILFVGPTPSGGSQINVYHPGSVANEVAGTCGQGVLNPTLQVVGRTAAQTTAPRVNRFVASQPGVFANGNVPAGFHLRASDAALTPIATCNADPTRCPVSSAGQQNFLILYTTGAETLACTGIDACRARPDRVRFNLTPEGSIQTVEQDLAYLGPYGRSFVGSEQANVRIKAGTGAGTYRLTVSQPASGFRNAQSLVVRLGPAS